MSFVRRYGSVIYNFNNVIKIEKLEETEKYGIKLKTPIQVIYIYNNTYDIARMSYKDYNYLKDMEPFKYRIEFKTKEERDDEFEQIYNILKTK
jgi:hypothetical protein